MYSLDSSEEDGGDMGWMDPDDIEQEFGDLDTIQALNTNTLSAPISQNYPDDPVEWLPQGIENSSVFEDYVFGDNVEGIVSDPINDTTYYTQGGYWLIMVLDSREGEEGEELHLQGILLDSEQTANEVKADLEEEDFATLAEEFSLHSSSKSSGGDMDWISIDEVESRFGEEALELEQDEVSEPIYEDISKKSGYWVIEVLEVGDRELIEENREQLIDDAFTDLLEEERNSEENDIVNHLDDEDGSEKLIWALEHI
jgi:parvulin-like peptidyl-prolyl isomerase